MDIGENKISVTRLAGEALFVSECLSFEAACANASSRKHSTAAESLSSGGSVKELAFSIFDCTPAPQGPQITVLSDVSDLSDSSDKSDYTLIAGAARDFRGWLTVTAYTVIRNVVRAFRRVVCEAKALFNRRGFFFAGGLRL